MSRLTLSVLVAWLFFTCPVSASVILTSEQQNAINVTFLTIPNISATDLAESAIFTSTGTPHPMSGGIGVLQDGVFPADGSAGAAYFSDADNLSITVNLGSLIKIGEVNTYSSDSATGSVNRAPQVYTLLGSTDGTSFTTIAAVDNNDGTFSHGSASS